MVLQSRFSRGTPGLILLVSLLLAFTSCKKGNDPDHPHPDAKPSINSFEPDKGPVGTQVILRGSNFSVQAADNLVKFNGISTPVTAATAT